MNTGEAIYKRKREQFEATWLEEGNRRFLKKGIEMSPTMPQFLYGQWGKKPRNNWFHLKLPSDSELARDKQKLIHARHPAIIMGLHYSLRWYWMGMCDVRQIEAHEIRAQSKFGIGWEGPTEWPQVYEDKVAPFTTLWLTRKDRTFDHQYAEQLPRAIASPQFYGKQRYDCVCCKMETENGTEDWICQLVMLFMAYRPSQCDDGGKWAELAFVRWFEDVAQEDFVNHKLKPVRDENVVIWKRVQVSITAGVQMMRWAVYID